MVLTAIKKYPNQISTAFKRFPLASTMAFFTFFTIVINTNLLALFEDKFVKPFMWLMIYPIAALLIALTTSLIQESRKSTSIRPQAIASGTWFVLSVALVFFLFDKEGYYTVYFVSAITLVYMVAFLGFFFAPFWKKNNENGVWHFLQKSIKAAVIAILVSAILLGAIEGLVFGFEQLFDADLDSDVYLNILYFCSSVIAPILFFTKIPSIDECLEEPPALSKFTSSTIRFLFIPVFTIGTLLFYAYILKFLAMWNMPAETPSYFVIGFMIYMLVLVTVMYPVRLATEQSFEKRFIKIIPAACIPLVILMSIDINNTVNAFGIDTDYIYAIALNIYFYVLIAILLVEKINRKMRYIAIVFCAMFFILTQPPFSASDINKHIWKSGIKNALAEQGYNKLPLNEQDANDFITKLETSEDKNARITLSRIQSLDSRSKEALAPFFSKTPELYKHNKQNICCKTETDTTENFESFEANINNVNQNALKIPQGAKKAFFINLDFNSNDFKYSEDTLSFLISITDDQDTSIHSTYNFRVTKQELKIDSLNTIETDSAIIGIRELHTEQWSKTGQSLRIDGLLFIK